MKNTLFFGISLFVGSFFSAQSVDLPYSYGFETADLDGWMITNEGAGNQWQISEKSTETPEPSEGTYYMLYYFHSTEPANTYLYSKGLNLKANENITLQFDYMGTDVWFPEKMEVRLGNATNPAAQTTQLWINEDIVNYPYETATVNFTVPTDGVYYLSFRAFSDTDMFYLSLDNVKISSTVLGTQNLDNSSLKYHPNPVKDILTITDGKEISEVQIFDTSGKQVFSKSSKSSKQELNLSHLKTGTYIVKANSNGTIKTFKFIKK